MAIRTGLFGHERVRALLRWLIYGLASLVGLGAFVYPFFVPQLQPSAGPAHAIDSPLLLGLVGGLSLIALLLETQGDAASDAKMIALLGVLVGVNAALSFLETAIPGPGGFSPVFFLIILGGYVYGARFGFLLGALTLFVSALVTGGIGPWLPYRMLVAGWIGLTSPVVKGPVRWFHAEDTAWEVLCLSVLGSIWGLLFGALMNLWFWPFASGPVEQHWQAGISLAQGIRRFLAFYVATSLIWDLARVIGIVGMLWLFGRPTLRTLRRFARRFAFEVKNAKGPDTAKQGDAR